MNDPEIEREIEDLWEESSQPDAPAAASLAKDTQRQTAIAHLKRLQQLAGGQEAGEHYSSVLSYLVTGRCESATDLDSLTGVINRALTDFLSSQ